MKLCEVLYLLIICVLYVESKSVAQQTLQNFDQICRKEVGMIGKQYESFDKNYQYTEDDLAKIRCQVECVFKKTKVYSDEKGFDIDAIVTDFRRANPTKDLRRAKQDFERCYKIHKNDDGKCETFFLTLRCFYAKYGQLNQNPGQLNQNQGQLGRGKQVRSNQAG